MHSPGPTSFRRSVSQAGMTLSANLWGASLEGETEARLRSTSVSQRKLIKTQEALEEEEQSESSEDEIETEVAAL